MLLNHPIDSNNFENVNDLDWKSMGAINLEEFQPNVTFDSDDEQLLLTNKNDGLSDDEPIDVVKLLFHGLRAKKVFAKFFFFSLSRTNYWPQHKIVHQGYQRSQNLRKKMTEKIKIKALEATCAMSASWFEFVPQR